MGRLFRAMAARSLGQKRFERAGLLLFLGVCFLANPARMHLAPHAAGYCTRTAISGHFPFQVTNTYVRYVTRRCR
jgi:hypothetical protein